MLLHIVNLSAETHAGPRGRKRGKETAVRGEMHVGMQVPDVLLGPDQCAPSGHILFSSAELSSRHARRQMTRPVLQRRDQIQLKL